MAEEQGPVHAPEFPKNVTWLPGGPLTSIEEGGAIVRVNEPRMYRLVNNLEIDSHDLTIVTNSDGLSLYAFTFTSCLVLD